MKPILLSFFCVFTLLEAKTQTGTEIFFKKGAELEYRNYSSRMKGFKLEPYETTRITLIVTDVKDSNNVTYSYITKKGTGITHPEKDHYEKRLVISKISDSVIKMPIDLVTVDTAYLADKYPNKKKMKGIYAAASPKEDDICTLTIDLAKGKFNYSPQKIVFNGLVRDFSMQTTNNPNYSIRDASAGKQGPSTSPFITDFGLTETRYTLTINGTGYRVIGKAKITTPAGNFDCYKIRVNQTMTFKNKTVEIVGTAYYNPEIGFIKTEQGDENTITELVRLKK